MLTLTLDVRKFSTPDERQIFLAHFEARRGTESACQCPTCIRLQTVSVAHIRACWNKLRVYMHRRFGVAPRYVAVIEFQKTTGLAHLHIVIDRYIPQAWAKEAWQAVGGGEQVHICHVDAHRIAPYVAKYISKEVLLGGIAGMRRVTTSRSIKLNEKKSTEYTWQVLKAPIDRVYVLHIDFAQDLLYTDGELCSFAIRE